MIKLFSILFLVTFTIMSLAQDFHSVGPAPVSENKIQYGPTVDAIGTRAFTQLSTTPTFQFGKLFLEGCTPTNIGTAFTITFPGGLMYRNGIVYTWNQSSPFQLWSIDTVTGVHTLVFNMTGVPHANFTGMYYDGTNVYGVSTSITASQIFTVNMTNGVCTPIGTPSTVCPGAISLSGRLNAGSCFSVDIVNDRVYKWDKTTGVATALSSTLGVDANFGQDACFDNNDGVFYWASQLAAGTGLRKIDTTTGVAGPVLCTYTSQPTGIVALPPVSAPPVACDFTWATQTSGVTTLLQSVDAVNENIAWTAGNTAVVRRTTDGGTTWLNANPNPGVITGDIYNIEAIDANTAFVTTSPGATFIYRTTNGGTNWTQVHTVAGGFINAIEFINATTGYATGDPVGGFWELLITTNGGLNWTQMPSAPAQVGSEAGWNNSFSIVGTHMWYGTNVSKVYHSSNLGLNWTSGPSAILNTYGVDYISATNGIAVGPAAPFMQKSLDGGATYTTVAALPAGTGTPFVSGAGTDFWAARGNTISRSTNNGDAWTTSFTGTGTFQHIDVVIGTNGCPTGWAVTQTGGIAKMTGTVVGISGNFNETPNAFSLMQNYPNPFNPTTNIRFNIPTASDVRLDVYDMTGKLVTTLVNDFRQAGSYTFGFNASDLASGVYIYKLTAGTFTESKKMLLIK